MAIRRCLTGVLLLHVMLLSVEMPSVLKSGEIERHQHLMETNCGRSALENATLLCLWEMY
jgi:hypothetical protein